MLPNPDPQQANAIVLFEEWFAEHCSQRPIVAPVFVMHGYAGTGKTTTAALMSAKVKGSVCFAAFTGKAANVLNSKLRKAGLAAQASTIYKLLYKPPMRREGETYGWRRPRSNSPLRDASLLVIDESSMLEGTDASRLAGFGVPTLTLGDPAQLAPAMGRDVFAFIHHHVLLTQIHRQKGGGVNPILQIAQRVRMGYRLPELGWHKTNDLGAAEITSRRDISLSCMKTADIVLVGTNEHRMRLNSYLRDIRGFGLKANYPQPGETVVCLRNEYRLAQPIFNGSLWLVNKSKLRNDDIVEMEITEKDILADKPITLNVTVPLEYFWDNDVEETEDTDRHQKFTFGYALTVHKSQGSKSPHVVLFNEPTGTTSRWLYTGVTRASERLTIVKL